MLKSLFTKKEEFSFLEDGDGTPIIILHGLMGGLSNFDGVVEFFPKEGYKIIVPKLPLYSLPLLKTTVKGLTKYIREFVLERGYKDVVFLGNSLGGHIALLYTKLFPEDVKALVLTGSSGLYENAMGNTYPRRGDYDFIRKKTEEVFYDPSVATKELVDDVFATVNDRQKVLCTLSISKSAIRHNMAGDLPKMDLPVCLIWGKNDNVTPPHVAEEFNELMPNSSLYWIDKCGHAAMMEHPQEFNSIMLKWLKENNI